MRTAVDKVGRGKERQVNARFSAMVSHFPFEAEFCNPASGWKGGQIERTSRTPPSALAAHARLLLPGGAERLTGDALPGTVGPDAARLATRSDRQRHPASRNVAKCLADNRAARVQNARCDRTLMFAVSSCRREYSFARDRAFQPAPGACGSPPCVSPPPRVRLRLLPPRDRRWPVWPQHSCCAACKSITRQHAERAPAGAQSAGARRGARGGK